MILRKVILSLALFCGIINCAYASPKWETVTDGVFEIDSYRLSVPNGWLVVSRLSTGSAMIFYPDAKHEWKI